LRNNGFMSGVITGAALGALIVIAMSPQVRTPAIDGASEMGNRMRKMWKRDACCTDDAPVGDIQ
jgi:hypothetical protein